MFIRLLPLITGLLPIIGANGAMWLGAHYGPLPDCFPYVDGCVSVSATGRNPPGSYLFRATHMPYAALLSIVWYFAYAWLTVLETDTHVIRRRFMFAAGLTGSVALVIYVTFLGTSEPIYEFMRRGGIYFYFLSTTLAQIAFALAVTGLSRQNSVQGTQTIARWLLAIAIVPFVFGVINLLQKEMLPYETADLIENQIEWIAATLMNVWFVVMYVLWSKAGFNIRILGTDSTSANS